MDFSEQSEHTALRDAVMAVTRSWGAAYFAERARDHRPTDELWRALGKQGFIGVNLPEEFGGGGGGLTELAVGTTAATMLGEQAGRQPAYLGRAVCTGSGDCSQDYGAAKLVFDIVQ